MLGFFCDVYNDNMANLIVQYFNESAMSPQDLAQLQANPNLYIGDSIEAAMEHFQLYVENNQIYRHTNEEKALEDLDIEIADVSEFREKIDVLIQVLDDETALENAILFPKWKAGVHYTPYEKVRYNGVLYKTLQAHDSQEGWTPDVTPSLFARVLIEDPNVIYEWEQPDSTNGYSIGDKVTHNGHTWISTADNNVWEPGTTGAPWDLFGEDATEPEPEPEPEPTDEPTPEVAAWEQKAYMIGDRVSFEGAIYESLIDNNVWSPSAYPAGWQLITE